MAQQRTVSDWREITLNDNQIYFHCWITPDPAVDSYAGAARTSTKMVPIRDTPHYRFALEFLQRFKKGEDKDLIIPSGNHGYGNYVHFEWACIVRLGINCDPHSIQTYRNNIKGFLTGYQNTFINYPQVSRIYMHSEGQDHPNDRYKIDDGAHRLSYLRAYYDVYPPEGASTPYTFQVTCKTKIDSKNFAVIRNSPRITFTYGPDDTGTDSLLSPEKCQSLAEIGTIMLKKDGMFKDEGKKDT